MNAPRLIIDTEVVTRDGGTVAVTVKVRGCACGVTLEAAPAWFASGAPPIAAVLFLTALGKCLGDLVGHHVSQHPMSPSLSQQDHTFICADALTRAVPVLRTALATSDSGASPTLRALDLLLVTANGIVSAHG